MRKNILLSAAVVLSLSVSAPALAAEWKQNSTGWWYQNDDGTNPAGAWQLIDGQWYYFKSDGYMNTGWIKVSGQWYYCEPSGEMRTSDLQTDVFTFKFNADGSCSNFYENTTPSTQAGWSPYNTASLETITNAILNGNVVYYNGGYWATPDYSSSLKDEDVVYFHDVSQDAADTQTNRFGLAELDIPDEDDDYSDDLDGFFY